MRGQCTAEHSGVDNEAWGSPVRFKGPIIALACIGATAFTPLSAALAQRQPPSPEQRIDRLERQVDEVQRRMFPKGRPADTAGFPDDPAATQSSVINLNQRLDALERQMTDMLRQTEENGNRLRSIESGMGQLKSDEEQRISALEQRIAAAAATETVDPDTQVPPSPAPAKPKPSAGKPPKTSAAPPATAVPPSDTGDALAASDPGEDAYTEGFRLWEAGNYEQAINALRAFVSAYPKHRRVSYANNLIGRALLDKGQARPAAEALLANYRNNPSGERAPDSLFYLGQALTQLGQKAQACKAYSELDAVYGAKIRPDLKKLETDAKAQAGCS